MKITRMLIFVVKNFVIMHFFVIIVTPPTVRLVALPIFPLLATIVACLASSSKCLLVDSIQEQESCLDKGPCGFGKQLLLVF